MVEVLLDHENTSEEFLDKFDRFKGLSATYILERSHPTDGIGRKAAGFNQSCSRGSRADGGSTTRG
jgi:hypothetical protein